MIGFRLLIFFKIAHMDIGGSGFVVLLFIINLMNNVIICFIFRNFELTIAVSYKLLHYFLTIFSIMCYSFFFNIAEVLVKLYPDQVSTKVTQK